MHLVPLRDPATPPPLTPLAFTMWVARNQATAIGLAALWGTLSTVSFAIAPYWLGRIVDTGMADGLTADVWRATAGLIAFAIVQIVTQVMASRIEMECWVRASVTTSRAIGHHVTRTGDAVTEHMPTGEVVATVAADALGIGELYVHASGVIGGIAAYATVAVIMLRSSLSLGLLVVVGLPLVVAALIGLMGPLQRRQSLQRDAVGRLTTLGTDTVAGLRVLRGIGGEDVFSERYREQSQRVRSTGVAVAQTQSILEGLEVMLPAAFTAAIVWVGAHQVIDGTLTAGQLVAFFGFSAALTRPLWSISQLIRVVAQSRVGINRMLRVLAVNEASTQDGAARGGAARDEAVHGEATQHETAGHAASAGHTLSSHGPAAISDPTSGLTVSAGAMAAIVSADPEQSARLAARLGHLAPPPGTEPDPGLAGVRLGSRLLASLGLHEVRRTVVVAEATSHLFSGVLRDEIAVRDRSRDSTDTRDGTAESSDLTDAIHAADANDIIDALPDGLDSELDERGRSLSGGQRQRIALARALMTQAPVLVLVEPTSAVDAHTEARIATRVGALRSGRTTVIATTSPLLLDRATEVHLVVDGSVVATGTHQTFITGDDENARTYRTIVSRSQAEEL